MSDYISHAEFEKRVEEMFEMVCGEVWGAILESQRTVEALAERVAHLEAAVVKLLALAPGSQ